MISEDLRNLAQELGKKLKSDSLTLGDIARAINIIAVASHDVRALENTLVPGAARVAGPDLPANVVRLIAPPARASAPSAQPTGGPAA